MLRHVFTVYVPAIATRLRLTPNRKFASIAGRGRAPSAVLRELPAIVFVNPAAGGGRAGRYVPAIREVFASCKIPAKFLLVDGAHSLESHTRTAIEDVSSPS
jgi:hypothetical protein